MPINREVLTKLKTETDVFLDKARAQNAQLTKEYEASTDNDYRYNKIMKSDAIAAAIEQASFIKTYCDELLNSQQAIANPEALLQKKEFFDAMLKLHGCVDDLEHTDPVGRVSSIISKDSTTTLLVKNYRNKIEELIPGITNALYFDTGETLAAMKGPFLSLKVLAVNFIAEAKAQNNVNASENLLTQCLTSANLIVEECNTVINNPVTISDVNAETVKIKSQLDALQTLTQQGPLTTPSTSLFSSSYWLSRPTDPAVLVNKFITDIKQTLPTVMEVKPEQQRQAAP